MNKIAMEAFVATVKEANLMSMAGSLGSRVIGMGTRAAQAVGQRSAYGNLVRRGAAASGGGKALARNVGVGTAGAGLLAAGAGAGMLAGRATA